MATTRRKIVRERQQRVSAEALSAFMDGDEERLRRALRLGPAAFTPMPVKNGYAIRVGWKRDVTPNNTLYSDAYKTYEMLDQAAKEYRAQQQAEAGARRRAAATKRVSK